MCCKNAKRKCMQTCSEPGAFGILRVQLIIFCKRVKNGSALIYKPGGLLIWFKAEEPCSRHTCCHQTSSAEGCTTAEVPGTRNRRKRCSLTDYGLAESRLLTDTDSPPWPPHTQGNMGGSQSVEIPGGGTEGYHVLRVRADWCPGEAQHAERLRETCCPPQRRRRAALLAYTQHSYTFIFI